MNKEEGIQVLFLILLLSLPFYQHDVILNYQEQELFFSLDFVPQFLPGIHINFLLLNSL